MIAGIWKFLGSLRRAFGVRWEDRHHPGAIVLDCWRYWEVAGFEMFRMRICDSRDCLLGRQAPAQQWRAREGLLVWNPGWVAQGTAYPGTTGRERFHDEVVWLGAWLLVVSVGMGMLFQWGSKAALEGLEIRKGRGGGFFEDVDNRRKR